MSVGSRALFHLALLWSVACKGGDPSGGDSPSGDDDDVPTETTSTTSPTTDDGSCDPECDAQTEVCVGGSCVSCAPTVEVPFVGDPGSALVVELDPESGPFEERRFRMRPIAVTGGGVVEVEGSAVEVFDASTGAVVASGAVVGETTLLVHGVVPGDATVTVRPTDRCETGAATALEIEVRPLPGLAGRTLEGYPHFEAVQALNDGEVLQVAIDPGLYPDRVGLPYDVYVVADRTAAEWAADPSLSDLGDGLSGTVTEGSVADNVTDAWLAPVAGPAVTTGYDVVFDFGRDGMLDPGDLVDGLDDAGISTVIDLTTPGPHAATSFEYSADYWNTMVVYSPNPPVGNHPLVVISHGNGHDYTWYDYLGNHLASWGYVVISHRNDTGPGPVTAAITTYTNTESFLGDLAMLGGGMLNGMVDTSRISWIGHSRGGEGVVIAYDKVFDGFVTPNNFSVSDLVLVSSIAPTLFEGPDVANPNDVAYHILAGSADGDVTGGVDCDLCQYFRIFQRATGPVLATYVQGATHNDFNCCGVDDGDWISGAGPQIGRVRAQAVAKSYYLALLEFYVQGNPVLEDYLGRAPEKFAPIATEAIVATQYKTAATSNKFVVDDFQAEPDTALSSSGGLVTATVENLVEGPLDDSNTTHQWLQSDPMNGMSQSDGDSDPARGIVFDFPDGSDLSLEFEVTRPDVSGLRYLSFRACEGTRHPYTEILDDRLSFTATLIDGSGAESSVDFAVYGRITEPFERTDGSAGSGWINEFQTLRIPLHAFLADGSGLDLTDITAVRFDFGAAHGSALGRVGLDDIEFVE